MVSVVKIGKIFGNFRSISLIVKNKNQKFQEFFNLPSHIELRESGIENRGLFSNQIRR